MLKKALLDSDIFIYRVGYSSEDKDEGVAIWRLDRMIETILSELEIQDYQCYLTSQDNSNFRYNIDPKYKSNRTIPKPLHYTPLREHLIKVHDAIVVYDMESDDAISIDYCSEPDESIIVSIDKDFKQVSGWHYNFVKKEKFYITKDEGRRFFYRQILTGDNVDGIDGLKGIGPVKADKALKGLSNDKDLFYKTFELYRERLGISIEEAFNQIQFNGSLLKIKQSKDEPIWQPPIKLSDLQEIERTLRADTDLD